MFVLILCVILIAAQAGAQDLAKKICYTQWFDRDDPSGMGDYETLVHLRKEYPGKICTKPLTIEVTTLSGIPARSTGQVFQMYDTVSGFACVNSEQQIHPCLDYRVRFGCRCPWPLTVVGAPV